MATTFYIRTKKETGTTSVIARYKDVVSDCKQSTGLKVSVEEWNTLYVSNYQKLRKNNRELFQQLDVLEAALNEAGKESGMSNEKMKDIISRVVRKEAKEAAQEKMSESLVEYYKRFLEEAKTGKALTEQGKRFARLTVVHFQQGLNKLEKFMKETKRVINWQDLDLKFHKEYEAFLIGENYSPNTIGTRFKELKALVSRAQLEGVTEVELGRKFKGNNNRTDEDSFALSRAEVQKLTEVKLDYLPIGYTQARDLFLVGIWTAQRVSDYGNIVPENIVTETVKVVENDKIVEKVKRTIVLRQKKTGARVTVPVGTALGKILDKYNGVLPKLSDQKINLFIKEVAKLAKLTDPVEVVSNKGGNKVVSYAPKAERITTHCARRTGCTLMYLSGMDELSIMRVSGHTTSAMLRKYVRADELDALRLLEKYDFFA